MEVPFVHEIDTLPEVVGGMAVEGVRYEGGLLQVGRGQEAKDKVEQLGREGPNLGGWSAELWSSGARCDCSGYQRGYRGCLQVRRLRRSCWQGVIHTHADNGCLWVVYERAISAESRYYGGGCGCLWEGRPMGDMMPSDPIPSLTALSPAMSRRCTAHRTLHQLHLPTSPHTHMSALPCTPASSHARERV